MDHIATSRDFPDVGKKEPGTPKDPGPVISLRLLALPQPPYTVEEQLALLDVQ